MHIALTLCNVLNSKPATISQATMEPIVLISIKKSQEESHGQNLAIFSRLGKNFRLQLVVEFVADAPNGQDIFR